MLRQAFIILYHLSESNMQAAYSLLEAKGDKGLKRTQEGACTPLHAEATYTAVCQGI